MKNTLEGFVAYLDANRLVDSDIYEENDSWFVNTNRLQRYVFLAKRFGLDMGYKYDMYLYGPQSRALMNDYLNLIKNRAGRQDGRLAMASVVVRLPESFKGDEFLRFVKGRDDDWLYMATTLIKRSASLRNRQDLIKNVEWTTPKFSIEYIVDVLDELQSTHMIQ